MTTVTWNRLNDVATQYFTNDAMMKVFNVKIQFKIKDESLSKSVVKLMFHQALKPTTKNVVQIDLMLNELFI
jgi:hypothetical protein